MTTARTIRARGAASPDQVWMRYADTRQWSVWSPQIRRVTTSAGPLLSPGLAGTVHPLVGPGVRFRVDTVDPLARTWSWTVRWGPVRLALEHGVDEDGGTWLTVRGPLPVVLGYLPLARLALGRLVK